ncbi:hypothetical protein EDD11_008527 [Mortierella claussenii]|nr:hypothetical protein EDD11_008527 [Mortierella claussenii]
MPEVALVRTANESAPVSTTNQKSGSDMKGTAKDKDKSLATSSKEPSPQSQAAGDPIQETNHVKDKEQTEQEHNNGDIVDASSKPNKGNTQVINGTTEAENEEHVASAAAAAKASDLSWETSSQDVEMKEASPAAAEVTDQNKDQDKDIPMTQREAAPASARETTHHNGGSSGIGEGINQEDLDGALLDGALDDYDDLDQDTEDTEVGNGENDFSDDDDDDDLDDVDDRLLDSSDKQEPGDDEMMHSPAGMSHTDTVKSDDRVDTPDESADQQAKEAAPVHSEDSDSDLPDPEGSDNEHDEAEDEDEEEEDEETDEEDADGDDEEMEEDEDEEPVKKASEPKKDPVFPQKPVLNRPSATEEELKDSGDELSDLSEFDDTDDSDEDDDMPEVKSTNNKESVAATSPSAATTMAAAQNNAKLTQATTTPAGGRKRSLQASSKEGTKQQEQEPIKAEQEDKIEIPNGSTGGGRARLLERKVSETEEVHHSDKESGSEAPEEEEEEEEKPAEEEEEEEEEDLETKQVHKDALEALTSIEVEFANLRDKMYEERMTELDREVEMINAGTHPELSSLMQEIEQKREQRLRFADMGKKYLNDIAQSAYSVAEYRAHCTFQSARRTTRTDMVRALGKKQQRMIMELTLAGELHKRKVTEDKATLVRARKLKRMEVNELKAISERRGFPTSSKLRSVSSAELDSDFAALGTTGQLMRQGAQG